MVEKRSAVGEGVDAPSFPQELRALFEAAGGGAELTLGALVRRGAAYRVTDSTLSGWMSRTRPSVPAERYEGYLLDVLLPHLEDLAARRSATHLRTSPQGWRSRLRSARATSKSRQGGRGPRIHPDSPGRFHGHLAEVCQNVLPRDFAGREPELDELYAYATAPGDQGTGYLWWQADAWAGKSALLAWFVLRHLPAGVDAVGYFIAERLGTNRREDFIGAVADQLARLAGRKRTSISQEPARLHELYEAAAQASRERGRTLLLVVDGLDEDAAAGSGPGGQSIAALLPRHVPAGMRVLVAGRANPPVPDDVPADHPLRDPGTARRLAPSPAAEIIRDMAMRELHALLDDAGIGSDLLGLLTVAGGPLAGGELAELAGVRPYDVGRKLRSVVGRSMAPGHADGLAPAAGDDHGGAAATYVLAHEELRLAAVDALGPAELAGYEGRLHAWADRYRDQGWPAATPDYLLTGYSRMLRHREDGAGRLAALVLHPARQLRLVGRHGVEIALADLDPVTAAHPGDTPRDLTVVAGAAASRELLRRHVRPLPGSVLRAVALLGDPGYARELALAARHAQDKAAALAEVALVLADTGHEMAPETAREAATWAQTAREQALSLPGEEDEAEAVAARAAVALIATGHEEAGLELLRSTWGLGTARYAAWTEAAGLLGRSDPESASQLLDEMEERAEDLRDSYHHSWPDDRVVRIQVWAILASASPERAHRIHDRAFADATALWAQAPALENVAVLAASASMLAASRPEQAAALTDTARLHVESVCREPGSASRADRSHIEVGFELTLVQLVEALGATGFPAERTRALLNAVPEELRSGRTGRFESDVTARARTVLAESEASEADDDSQARELDRSEAGRAADAALQLAERGRYEEAKRRLKEAMGLTRAPGSAPPLPGAWLPALVEALGRSGRAADAEELTAQLTGGPERARSLAALSLAHTDAGRVPEARRAASAAAEAAGSDPEAWAAAAQALAWAGAGSEAVALIARAEPSDPADRLGRAAWGKGARQARIAVAEGAAASEPAVAAELVNAERDRLVVAVGRPRGLAGLLPELAGLLPAAAATDTACVERLADAIRRSSAYMSEPPQAWRVETVLVDAVLRTRAGEDATGQLDWLDRAMRFYEPENLPINGLAVLHALLGDTAEAWRVADLQAIPERRAIAFAAVAGHLARVPVRVAPFKKLPGADPLTHTVRALAHAASADLPGDEREAAAFVREALAGDGWHHALPVLARIAPEAVTRVRDIAVAHLRSGTPSRTPPPGTAARRKSPWATVKPGTSQRPRMRG
ncbi:hypothetical protein ACFV6G_29745 [Streptomyces lavendulae]|uniref:hypothetical protein n=1 Tax=Streptomyces lavendulae TaxID=1914 RepID=UPI0036AA8B2B